MNTLSKLLALLSRSEKRYAAFLLMLALISALLDVLGVASILPFMAVLLRPEIVDNSTYLTVIFEMSGFFGVINKTQFLIFLGVTVFVLLLVSLCVKAYTNYLQTHFALMREYSIGVRLVDSYLAQPYSWYLNQNTTNLGKTVLSEVSVVISQGLMPLMVMMAQATITFFMLILLFFVDPLLMSFVGLGLASTYTCIFLLAKRMLKGLGKARFKANQSRYLVLGEALDSIKQLKLSGLENFYLKRFSDPAKIFAEGQASAFAISQLPRFFLEAITFGGLLLITLYFMFRSTEWKEVLPVVSLYAYAGYRLMPALQQIYGAIAQLRYVGASLDKLHSDISSLGLEKLSSENKSPLDIKECIELKGVSFRYPNAKKLAVENVSIKIPLDSCVGFVGKTGSGKTTIIDLILGLLETQKGTIIVGGVEITPENKKSWQQNIGYVPQQINLVDNTVLANIAFGLEQNDIDFERVKKAAKVANIDDFIASELPAGYNTGIGERGVRLSGGQRQRLGIARAVYKEPKVIIFDEATSALDAPTESSVIDSITNMGKDKTIIMIAHRLSTLQRCDNLFVVEEGRITASGSFQELKDNNEHFRKMIGQLKESGQSDADCFEAGSTN